MREQLELRSPNSNQGFFLLQNLALLYHYNIFYLFDSLHILSDLHLEVKQETSLVVQWLRIHLPMQGTWVGALVQEDPTCHGATKPMSHNY